LTSTPRDLVMHYLRDEHKLHTFELIDKRPKSSGWQKLNDFVPEPKPFGVIMSEDSDIFVIDVDDISLKPYFEDIIKKTYSNQSGRGFHIYGKANNKAKGIKHLKNEKNQGIDIIFSGGYVVGETSDHYARNNEGNYVKSGKKYALLSQTRQINYIDYESEIKPILEKLGFNLQKERINETKARVIQEGFTEGNRNNDCFKISCNLLKTKANPDYVWEIISATNDKSKKPLSKQELEQVFNQAKKTVDLEREEENSNFTEGITTHEILSEEPKQLRAITLTEDGIKMILVYLHSKIIEDGKFRFGSRAYIVCKYADGRKEIRDLELDQDFKEKFQCNLYTDFDTLVGKWKKPDIDKYLASNEKVSPAKVFDNLMKLERHYFHNKYDFDYYYQVCWIAHTYFYPLFEYTAYNDITGIKGVGKSKRMSFLSFLTYNGLLTADASVSSIFRTIEGTGCTLCLDESERLSGDKESRADLENLLRNGNQKNGKCSRAGDKRDKFKPQFFSVFSPKALGHIDDLDNVLEDRCISTIQERTRDNNILKTFPSESRDSLFYETRKDLYELFLEYAETVPELIPEAQELLSDIIFGREQELWIPALCMALLFERHGKKGIVEKILAKVRVSTEQRKISDMEGNLSYQVLSIVENNLQQLPTQSSKLYEFINKQLESEYHLEKFSDKKLFGILARLGFTKKRENGYFVWTNLDSITVRNAKDFLGLIDHTQDTLNETDSTHKKDDSVGSVGSV